MKTLFFLQMNMKIIFASSLLILFGACDKEDNMLCQTEGYIAGFDPCTIHHHYRIGYIIISTDMKDTLITYNLSDHTFKMPASVLLDLSDTLYKIPASHFQNYPYSTFFPDTLRYKYKVRVSYLNATENEMIYNLCSTDINYVNYNAKQVIIKSASK